MSDLHEYLVQKRAAVHAIKALAQRPDYQPHQLNAKVTAEGRSGVRRIRIRDFQIISDSGPNLAGYDLGPGSPEIILGALGSCLTHTFLIQAALHEIELDAVEVELTAQMDGRAGSPGHEDTPVYPHNITYIVNLVSDSPESRIQALRAAVERTCPVLNLIQRPQTLRGAVVVTAPERAEEAASA